MGAKPFRPEKIVPAECGRSSTRPQNRQDTTFLVSLPDGFVTEVKTAVLKVATRIACLLAAVARLEKESGR